MNQLPEHYRKLQERYGPVMDAVKHLGQAVREAGPLSEKEVQLVQLGAAAALKSEGAIHSHVRRALEAGASPEEIRHAIVLLTSTLGYPTVAAALSWVDDVLEKAS